jgi:flagellar protein FliO/FliZ
MDPVRYISGIALVALLLAASAWLLRRFSLRSHVRQGSRVEILQTLALGTRERLVVVRFSGKEMLLGVTAHGINRLDETASSRDGGVHHA